MRSSLQRWLGVTREVDSSLQTVKLRLPTVTTVMQRCQRFHVLEFDDYAFLWTQQ